MNRPRWSWLLTVLVLLFLYAPIAVLVVNSFNSSRYGGQWEGFSWVWYEKLWQSRTVWRALALSLQIAFLAALASMVLGTLAALALHRFRGRLQRLHLGLLSIPLVMPDVLMGVSLLLFFVALGVDTGFLTIWIAHVTFCVSYVAMTVLARLQDFDFTLVEAARDLGASTWQTATRVLLPLIAPGVVAGGLLAFTLSVDDYVITFFVRGVGVETLPVHVYSMITKSRELPVINALSTLLLALTFLIVTLSYSLTKSWKNI
jgi:spermidine/putrescine transport system permease protein